MAHLQAMEGHKGQRTLEMKDKDEVLQLLKDKLTQKEPYSLVRYGDGEAMVLDGDINPYAIGRVVKRQFTSLSYEDAFKVRDILIKALSECDMLGIPFGKKLDQPDSYWFKAQSILQKHVPTMDKELCSIDIAYHLEDRFKELFTLAPRIFCITCRDTKRIAEVSGKDVDTFAIAPEMMFTTYEGPAHYPDQYVKIESWMDKRKIKGALCLVGGGVLGKIYCNWFRDRGGVAFDIGSMFDQWAGFVTRGPNRGKDVKTNDNTL